MGWIESDTAQAAGLVAEYLWSLFPIREILEAHGSYDQDDAPLDGEAQLGSFVSYAIDYLEDAFELLNGRRPVPISVRLAEAAISNSEGGSQSSKRRQGSPHSGGAQRMRLYFRH